MGWLDNLKTALTAPITAANMTVDALRNQARSWAAKVVQLNAMQAPPQYAAKKADLMSRAKFIKEAIEKAIGVVPEFSAMNLGAVVPLIGGAALATAAALIAKWTYDFLELRSNIEHYNKMVSDGIAPATAANLVVAAQKAAAANTVTGNIARVAPWLIGGVVVFVFRDKIFK